jgi:hypothetical protein
MNPVRLKPLFTVDNTMRRLPLNIWLSSVYKLNEIAFLQDVFSLALVNKLFGFEMLVASIKEL